MSQARDNILERLRASLARRESVEHPGGFSGPRPAPPPEPLAGFQAMFEAAGGEVVRVADLSAAAAWLSTLSGPRSMVVGEGVPHAVIPRLSTAPAEKADLGISLGQFAIAETGTLVLFSGDGRRAQLLAPTHVIVVEADRVRATLAEVLAEIGPELPSAVGLHSGPSKSADIGQVMVRGVHGPGRSIALVVG